MARRRLDARPPTACDADQAAARHRRLRRRPPVHLRRRRVLASRRRTTQSAPGASWPTLMNVASKPLQAGRRGSAHRRRSPFQWRLRPGSCSSTTCRFCRSTSSRPRSTPGRSAAPGGLDTPVAGDRRARAVRAGRVRAAASGLVFARNPVILAKDAAGAPLPCLDRVVVEVVPDQNARAAATRRRPDST